MNKATLNGWVLKFKRSRDNLLLMIIFTIVNLLLIYFNSDFYLLFSATIPTIGLAVGIELGNAFLWIGAIFAIVLVGFYLGCWAFSKKIRILILLAFIFFTIDTALLIVLMLIVEFDVMMLIDLAFHIWILYYLYHGAMAWSKIRDISEEEFALALANITITEEKIIKEATKKEEKEQ